MKTLTHKHHIVPRHMGGSDDTSNLIELSVDEHAEAHRKLWEEHGRWQDKLAWNFLSKRVTKEEAIRIAVGESNRNRVWSEEQKNRIRNAMVGNTNRVGKEHSKITIDRISNSLIGKKRPDHSFKMKSLGVIPPSMKDRTWKQEQVICPHCGKSGGVANMKRYHFDNCGVLEKC